MEAKSKSDIEKYLDELGTNGRISASFIKNLYLLIWDVATGTMPNASNDDTENMLSLWQLNQMKNDEVMELINKSSSISEVEYYLETLVQRKRVSRKLLKPFFENIWGLASSSSPQPTFSRGPSQNYVDYVLPLKKFSELSGSRNALTIYAIAWYISDRYGGEDNFQWTDRIKQFKRKKIDSTNLKGAKNVLRQAVGQLLSDHRLNPETTGLIIPISAKKTKADSNSALYQACEDIARHYNIKWLPHNIKKEITTPIKIINGVRDKIRMISNKYECNVFNDIETLLILDDMVTTGATMGEIVRALKDEKMNLPVTPIGLAIGKTYDEDSARSIGEEYEGNEASANSSVPPEWDELWGR